MSVSPAVSDGLPRLRTWQADALDAALSAYADGALDHLVTATPGAGKTTFALALATRLRARRDIDRVVVVCPTDHLRTQWAFAAAAAGLVLDPTLPNAVGPVRADAAGYVTTYAQVAQRPMVHRARVGARRTLVILDEIHHAGDGLSWGEAVAEAFDPARRRLCLTGTPFRTRPDERIPFVRYEPDGDGLRSVADSGYGYREALRDGVVRPVVFAAYTGVSRWRTSAGEVVAASLTEPLTRSVEAAAWRTALAPSGAWVPHVLAAMDERITQLRASGMPDAAGLVLASDQDDARAYARIVASVTGEEPTLVLSDDPQASEKLSAFAASDARIAVCVRMISEGVDIPRAACLAWLTSYRTPLFFAQAVGRVVRARRRGEIATVFLPAVRPLLALAAELEVERDHVMVRTEPTGELDALPRPDRPEGGPGDWQPLEAQAEFAHVLHGGRAHVVAAPTGPGGDAGQADEGGAGDGAETAWPGAVGDPDAEDFLGLPGLLDAQQTAALLARRDGALRARVSASRPPEREPSDPRLDWRQAPALRKEIHALVGQVAARTGAPHATVHARLRRAVPGPGSASAPVEVLIARRDSLLSQLGG